MKIYETSLLLILLKEIKPKCITGEKFYDAKNLEKPWCNVDLNCNQWILFSTQFRPSRFINVVHIFILLPSVKLFVSLASI